MRKDMKSVFRTSGRLYSALLFLVAIGLISCIRLSDGSQNQLPVYPDLKISMSRAPCMGDCPVYDLVINGDGTVIYTGWSDVEILETRESRITQTEIRELVKEFEAINFLEIEAPQLTIMDCPITAISLTLEGKSNEYYDYYVCGFETFPYDQKVLDIGRQIDEVTNSKQWLGESAVKILEGLAQ